MILRYIIELIITKVAFFFRRIISYPIAYVFRKLVRKLHNSGKIGYMISFPLWIYLNDGVSEDGFSQLQQPDGTYNYEWFWIKIGRYPNWHPLSKGGWWNEFIISFKWSGLRNYNWNLYTPLQLEHVEKTNIIIKKSICYNRTLADHEIKPEEERNLKFKYADGTYANNEGPYLNYGCAVLGKLYCTYTQGKRKLFRYGKATIKLYSFFGKKYLIARELTLGYTNNHSDFTSKLKFLKVDEISLADYENYLKHKTV